MRLLVLAVGQRQPAWAEAAWDDFAKRFPPEMRLELKALKAEPRASRDAARCMAAEAQRIEAALPKGARRVVLDERGRQFASKPFAEQIGRWRDDGIREVRFLIGAADGHDDALRREADLLLAFGEATWPHMLARAMLAEQLWRATSILANHPYHREG